MNRAAEPLKYVNSNKQTIMIMKVGIVLPEAGPQATKENIIQAAKQAEEEVG